MEDGPCPYKDRVVFWYHDESTFYANDHCKVHWVHMKEKAVPQSKGEGASLMVADFISADYGWLCSWKGQSTTQKLFCAGKACNGYYTNDDIIVQAEDTMDILEAEFPNETHCLIYDNAMTHTAQASDALSASKMPKGPSEKFSCEINVIGTNGKPVYGPDGRFLKQKVRMQNGYFHDGTPQDFYFPDQYPQAGMFKGIAIILEKCGYKNCSGCVGRWAECVDFLQDSQHS